MQKKSKIRETRKSVNTMSEREKYYFTVGNRFGYPICCIQAFIADIKELDTTGKIASRDKPGEREKWAFGGFVPCERHVTFIKNNGYANMADKINKNRKYPYPFPLDEHDITAAIMGPFMSQLDKKLTELNEHKPEEECVCEDCKTKSKNNAENNAEDI